ncbi:threo-3-hydroxy-L-aspartate ammonia-lyase [Mesorhizobium muleiense]|uniref:threo-3-hydroxy-L-aspartate ammonia-lyase n=1 Tax=Mesorhizobium muleiense TaxID=1004279 RepID=UPI001F1F068F|nr:threo-3-hydroxy-L-aspartate ammonia-lyase [Mesorhizobium muleiense]MCF6116880.1 threo-3-hydroxy-L-aspartate ammonia-lyase [Mesorhizobium muleiense]
MPLNILTFDDVLTAAARLAGLAHRTPVLTSRTFNELTGAEVFFKCENFQRGGAFKFRGAMNALLALDISARARGVVAYSSGNHAQALAYAAAIKGVKAVIIMPRDAPELKVRATRGYGAEVIFYDRYSENREEIGGRIAAERGAALIPPYDHPDVIAGQGTATLELIEEAGSLDALYVCLGGGGLLAGAALAAAECAPACRVVGVEPEAGNDGQQSLARGEVVTIEVPKSIADGAVVTHLGAHNFPVIRDKVAAITTVSDDALIEMMHFFAERMKIVVEPTGCLAAAAVRSESQKLRGQRIGVIVSGGNVDLTRFASLIMAAADKTPREQAMARPGPETFR